MVLNKIKKAIEDSKRKKQFRIRAKDRGERKLKKEKGLYSKFVDKKQILEQRKQKQAKQETQHTYQQSSADVLNEISRSEQKSSGQSVENYDLLSKHLEERNIKLQDFTIKLKNSEDSQVLEVFSSVIENQRVVQNNRSLMCLLQLCQLSLGRSLKESVPSHIEKLFSVFAIDVP